MKRACLCLDLDGFYINGQFIVCELGWCDGKRMGALHYGHGLKLSQLTRQDRATVYHVYNYITGLPFYPTPRERSLGVHPQTQLEDDVVDLWKACKTPEASVVVYKGGHLERDLLEQLRIPHFNLETVGCPTYEKLHYPTFDCGCHKNCHYHRSMSECYKFMQWYNDNKKAILT